MGETTRTGARIVWITYYVELENINIKPVNSNRMLNIYSLFKDYTFYIKEIMFLVFLML